MIIELDKTLSDGRLLRFHRVYELIFAASRPDFVTVVIGSWETEEAARSQGRPAATTVMELPNNAATRQNNFLARIIANPGWRGGKLKEHARRPQQ